MKLLRFALRTNVAITRFDVRLGCPSSFPSFLLQFLPSFLPLFTCLLPYSLPSFLLSFSAIILSVPVYAIVLCSFDWSSLCFLSPPLITPIPFTSVSGPLLTVRPLPPVPIYHTQHKPFFAMFSDLSCLFSTAQRIPTRVIRTLLCGVFRTHKKLLRCPLIYILHWLHFVVRVSLPLLVLCLLFWSVYPSPPTPTYSSAFHSLLQTTLFPISHNKYEMGSWTSGRTHTHTYTRMHACTHART